MVSGLMAEALLATVALGALALAASGYLAQRLRAPPALGYLVVGILLSPHTIGVEYFHEGIVDGIAEIGVLFLLFLIGLELDLARLRRVVKATAWVMPFDLLLPMALAGGVARLAGWSVTESIALGAAVALSSTLLGERLTAPATFGSEARTRVLGILISEDVAAGALLAGLAILGSGVSTADLSVVAVDVGRLVFFLILLTALAVLVVPRILDAVARRHVRELVVLWGIAVVVLWGYLGLQAGSAELGAFVAGVAAAEAGSRFVARNALHAIRDASVALFFFASGLAADILPVLLSPWVALGVAGLFFVAKVSVHIPASVASGLKLPDAVRTAFALGTLGEFSLVLAAVADRSGVAHPMLQGTVVVAMLILLPIAAALVGRADNVAGLVNRLPGPWRAGLETAASSMRRTRPHQADVSRRRSAVRRLIANLLVLIAWVGLAVWAVDRIAPFVPFIGPVWAQTALWALALAVAIPVLRGAFRAYRDLVWVLVGLQPGERVGAGRVRMRIVDAFVALTTIPALAILALSIPAALPVLFLAIAAAAVLAALAWRRLTDFQGAMEQAMGRVLGNDPAVGRILDQVLTQYPWGVRSVAVAVPPGSPVVGRSIGHSGIATVTGAMIAVIQRRKRELVGPGPEELLLAGDTLILLGDPHQLERAEALIVASGEALPLAAQSMDASVEDIAILEGMACVGKTLGHLGIRSHSGAMIVGHWAVGGHRPRRFNPDREVRVGDRLLILGTPLQISRAQDLLENDGADEEE